MMSCQLSRNNVGRRAESEDFRYATSSAADHHSQAFVLNTWYIYHRVELDYARDRDFGDAPMVPPYSEHTVVQ